MKKVFICCHDACFSLLGTDGSDGSMTKPADYFGFEPGSDRNLFTYEQLIAYLQETGRAIAPDQAGGDRDLTHGESPCTSPLSPAKRISVTWRH